MLRTTDKGKTEVLPLRGCCAIALLGTTDKGKTEVLRLAQDDKNEIKPEILPAEKNAVRMTDPAIGRFSIKVVNVWQKKQPD